MDNKRIHQAFYIAELIEKFVNGTLTAIEGEVMEYWLNEHPDNKALFEEITASSRVEEFETFYLAVDSSRALTVFKQRYPFEGRQFTLRRRLLRKLSYVAAVLVAAITILWFSIERQPQTSIATVEFEHHDIQPGGNRATLTFADGKSISLSKEQTGIIVNEKGIEYQDGVTEVVNLATDAIDQFILATPKGGVYSITLSDGTKVWLNAESNLKYPSRFSKEERVVELDGEAYFDVAKVEINETKNKSTEKQLWPFVVVSRGQRVEVLGTKFNVSVYGDQPELKTTLVEGSVRLVPQGGDRSSGVILKPGQQGILFDGSLAVGVKTVDTESLIAWKDGYFYFNNTPTVELMKEVARWYDVEIVYKGKIPDDTFSGKVKRNTTLMGLLEILQISTLNVKLEDNKLIIN